MFCARIIALLILGYGSIVSAAISISVENWSHTELSVSGLNAGDYFSNHINNSQTIALSVTGADTLPVNLDDEVAICGQSGQWKWQVQAYLSGSYPTGLNVSVQRTNNGTASTLSGSTSTITTLSSNPQTLFCGMGNAEQIALKYNISNFDVTDGSGSKTWTVKYRVETL